jgi:hypothetical protein
MWPSLSYDDWSATCDTLHAHTQVLGKLAVALAPPEPQLQHAALRLTARGWETPALPAPDGSAAFVACLDLHEHELRVETSAGARIEIPLIGRSVGSVTRELLPALHQEVGSFVLPTNPQEVPWTTPFDEDEEHATYVPEEVATYFACATQAALALAAFRAPWRGRATPVNAWWGSFDLAVNLFSGEPAAPPSPDFIMRNAMDAQEVAVGWWPGDPKHPGAAFYAYAHPAPQGFSDGNVEPQAARWDDALGEYVLEWEDVRAADDPHEAILRFARSTFRHACAVCDWDPELAESAHGTPPPIA